MRILFESGKLLYIIQLVQLTVWLQITFIWSSTFAMKPAHPPIFQRKPFIAAWNAPTDQCSLKYNIILNLKMFHVIGSPLAKARGQNVTIFYVNRLGYYPWYTSQEIPVNGGLPQNFSLQTHLEKAGQDIKYYIPAEHFKGLAVIDWEYWRPQWARNWNTKDIYRRKSRKLISETQRNISANDIEHLAKLSFEESAKAFMKETIELGIKSRPLGLWGYYLYPDCHNYNFHDQKYTGSCPETEVLRNNELSWLWDSSAALYPSIVIKKSLGNSENILRFSQFRVNESMRISSMTSHDYTLPVFVYTRLGYREDPLLFLSKKSPQKMYKDNMLLFNNKHNLLVTALAEFHIINCHQVAVLGPNLGSHRFLSLLSLSSIQTLAEYQAFQRDKQDLVSTIGESAALGAAGVVIWGDMNLTSSEGNCTKVKQFVASELGVYIINVTKATEMCSKYLCQNNGRCIRRIWKALDYLHLNPKSFRIEASEDQELTVRGEASSTDLEVMSQKFVCHCYQGYEGADCRKIETSDEQPGNSADFLLPRTLVMINLLPLPFYFLSVHL